MLYHQSTEHDIVDIPLLSDMVEVREIFIKCKSHARVFDDDIPAPILSDLPPLQTRENGYLTDTNYYPYFICEDCLHFICFFDIIDKEPTTYAKAGYISEVLKEGLK